MKQKQRQTRLQLLFQQQHQQPQLLEYLKEFIMTIEKQGFGDNAVAVLNTNVADNETLGISGHYHVECRDSAGNLKWEDNFPNLGNAIGKQLMFDTLLKGAAYTVTGPFLGLIN